MKSLSLLLALSLPLQARDIHVGKDADAPTIHHAIKMAVAGDTIYLEPKVYRDYAGFYGKKGEPGKPITLDGHGATLEGSDPIDPSKWREVSPGLFANDDLMPGLSEAVIGRWFFLFDGRMQHMGRTSKGKQAPLKKPEELQAGEWTFVKDPSREKPPSKAIYGTFYLKVAAGAKLADAKIFAPMRSAGVQMSGDNAHLVIRNITSKHVYNDGFNSLQAPVEIYDAIFSGPDAARFSLVDVPPFVADGTPASITIHFDDTGVTPGSSYSATVELLTSDLSGLPGGVTLDSVTFDLLAGVPFVKGDFNFNAVVDCSDIAPFVSVLLNPPGATALQRDIADMNNDTRNDGLDIQLFRNALICP